VGEGRRSDAKSTSKDSNRRDPQEWTKLVFEYYKHLTTLNGVAVAVLLTIYREEILNRGTISYSLVLFGIGVLCCSIGMIRLMVFFPLSPGSGQMTNFPFLARTAGILFTSAVGVIVVAALDYPGWLAIVALVFFAVAYLLARSGRTIFGYGFPRDRR
jgi:hypothetical protein